MAKSLISSLSRDFQSVPEEYVLPPEKRPQEFLQTSDDNIPVIDLSKAMGTENDRRNLVEQLIHAGQDFGIFHVINHGIAENMMEDIMKLYKEFFDMPYEETEKYNLKRTADHTSQSDHLNWKHGIRHPLNYLEAQIQSWPEKPTRYREVVAEYSRKILKLGSTILELICEGLGLERGYFEGERSLVELLQVNHYPPCPDPSLTMGLFAHGDGNLITILQQDVFGLQFLKDGLWIGVNVVPNSFVVNIACQLQVISNGKLRSPDHRVVTNSETSRTSIGIFMSPNGECVIEPAKALLNDCNPPVYRAYKFEEFLKYYLPSLDASMATALEPFKLRV